MMRTLSALLVVAALITAGATATLIFRLPDPPVHGETDFGAEARFGTYTEQNAERRNEYLWAGGIVIATLLGAAFVVSRRKE